MPVSGTFPHPLGGIQSHPPGSASADPDLIDRNSRRLRDGLDRITAQLNSGVQKVYDVMGFGAKGNGLTDDTAAIQAAATAATKAKGGVVFFPAGVYLISAPIIAGTCVTFQGIGWGPVTGGADDTIGSVIQASSAGLTGFFDVSSTVRCVITGLRILAFNAANTTLGIFDTSGASSYCTIEDNHFRYFGGDGINLKGNVARIFKNSARLMNNGPGHIIHLNNGSSDNFIAFNDLGSTDGVNGDGIFLDGTTNGSQVCTITGNEIFNCRYGINLTASSIANRIIENRCEKHALHGIRDNTTVGASWSGNLIANNVCYNNGSGIGGGISSGIIADGCKSVQIIANRCFDDADSSGNVQQVGVFLNGATDCDVIANRVFDTTLRGIYAFGGSGHLIEANRVRNVQREGIFCQTGSTDHEISGNFVTLAGQATDNTYDAISVSGTCSNILIHGNNVRHGGGAKQTRFGIRINSADCVNCTIGDNELTTAGRTGALSDAGTGTNILGNTGAPNTQIIFPSEVIGTDPGGAELLRIGGSAADVLATYRPTNTASAGVGGSRFYGQDSVNAVQQYGGVQGFIGANTAGAADGGVNLAAMIAGTETNVARVTKAGFTLLTVGTGLLIKEGTNATMGITPAMVLGTTTVSTTKVTANSRIFLTVEAPGGTIGSVYVSARTPGTSFVITSTSGIDTSTVSWLIVEPA